LFGIEKVSEQDAEIIQKYHVEQEMQKTKMQKAITNQGPGLKNELVKIWAQSKPFNDKISIALKQKRKCIEQISQYKY
jgi:hypothetical protein